MSPLPYSSISRRAWGERLRVSVENGLTEEATVHWHGMRVPNAMDGVPDYARVVTVRHCGDAYEIETADGARSLLWGKNVRLKIDGVETGPRLGTGVILRAGTQGDHVSVIFSGVEDLKDLLCRGLRRLTQGETTMTFTIAHPNRRTVLAMSGGVALSALVPGLGLQAASKAQIGALCFDGDTLLAAGDGSSTSGDGGRSWSRLPGPDGMIALATHPERPGRIFAGSEEGGIIVSLDGGMTWESSAKGLPVGVVGAITVAAGEPDIIYAAVRGDGLWKSENAGATWEFVMDRPWLEDAERDPLALASVNLETGMGGIWIYAGTETGLTRVPDCFCRWQDVQSGNAMDALVSGDAPPSEAPLPTGETILSLVSAPAASSTLYAALPSGLWASRDGGVVWSVRTEGSATAVAVHPEDEYYVAAVIDGNLKLSRDGGTTWTARAAL